jgi:hypothetical protein
MPSYTLQVPNSEDAVLKELAKREGIPVKWLLVWQIKAAAGLPLPPRPPCKPDEQVAA